VDVLWQNCVVTKLSGSLGPSEMDQDLIVVWNQDRPTRGHLYSRRGARVVAMAIPAFAFAIFIPIAILMIRKRMRTPGAVLRYLQRVLLPVVLGVALLSLGFYCFASKVDVQVSGRSNPYSAVLDHFYYKPAPADASADAVLKTVETMLAQEGEPNRLTGAPVTREASPGNYNIRSVDGKHYLIQYDKTGAEYWEMLGRRD